MTAPITARGRAAERSPDGDGRRWWVLAVVGLAQLMVVLDATIVNIALPSAQADLGFTDNARQWIVTAYALAFGSLLLLGGRVADLFGRKTALIIGLAGFGSPRCSAALSVNVGHADRRAGPAGPVRRAARAGRAVHADHDVRQAERAGPGLRGLRGHRRRRRRGRAAAGRPAHRVPGLALDAVRQPRHRGRRPPGRHDFPDQQASRAPAGAGHPRRGAGVGGPVRDRLRVLPGREQRLELAAELGQPHRRRVAAHRVRALADPDRASAAAAAGRDRAEPRGLVPGDVHHRRGHLRRLPVPHLLLAADAALLAGRRRASRSCR